VVSAARSACLGACAHACAHDACAGVCTHVHAVYACARACPGVCALLCMRLRAHWPVPTACAQARARTHARPPPQARGARSIPLSTLLLTRAKGSSSTTIGLGLPGLAPCCPSSGAATIAPPASHRPGPGTTGAGAGARLLSRTLRSTPQLLSARSAPASARRSASRPHTEHPHADTGAVHALLLQLLSVGQPGRFVRHGNLICT